CQYRPVVIEAACERGLEVGALFAGEAHSIAGPRAGHQRHETVRDIESRVAVAEATLAFYRQGEILAPDPAGPDMAGAAGEMQTNAVPHDRRQASTIRGNLRIEAGRPSLAVMVAVIGEERDAEPGIATLAFQFPREVDGIGTGLQPDPVLDDRAAAAKP